MKKEEFKAIHEKLDEISSKLGSMDISKAFELSSLYIGKDVFIQVNSLIPQLERIKKFMQHCNILFSVYTPDSAEPLRFDIHFGKQVEFMDLYIITAILKNFGLQSVFFTNETHNIILIGSYITQCDSRKDPSLGIEVDELLKLPFYASTSDLLANHFSNDPEYEQYLGNDHFEVPGEYYSELEDDDDGYQGYYGNADPHHKHWDEFELSLGDWDYDPMNEAHDPGNNPWIDVFGPGEEAEMAYLNTH